MNRTWIEARQTKYAAYVTLYIVVILCIVSVANVLANRYNKSYDATANKRYSLSDQTAKIVKGVSQPLVMTYYDKGTAFQTGKDILDRYATLSPKVKLDYVDPDKNPEAARAAGITKYGTTVVQIGAKKEQASAMTEEAVTGAIIRDLKSGSRNVCFLTGSGERQIDDADRPGFSHFKDMLAKDDYTPKSINLLEKPEIPADCTVLVVGGPKTDYQQPEVDAIKNYVQGGGRAMFLLDLSAEDRQADRGQRGAEQFAAKLGREPGQRPGAGPQPGGSIVWCGPDHRAGFRLRSPPHRERHEGNRDRVSDFTLTERQEHG